VAAILTGMVPYDQINIETPVSDAFRQVGLPWARFLVSVGAMTGITSVLLVMMLSQPRVWLAMARDGLFPESFLGAVHEKYRTPRKATILTGVAVALGAAFLPLRALADLTNIGTLFAFVFVCIAVLIMRVKHPEAERPFRAPLYPVIPILGILTCLILMFSLAKENWYRLFGWLALGFVIYFGYGKKHSVMARLRAEEAAASGAAAARN
jgi:APA family basic amino acid/polyamine antiporter